MNNHFFSSSVYSARRKSLSQLLSGGFVLLAANEEAPMNYKDNTYPFRQDSTFLYFSGLDKPGLFLLIDIKNNLTTLIGDEISADDVVWTGPEPTLIDLQKWADIDQIIGIKEGQERIKKLKADHEKIHYLPIYRGDHAFLLSQWLGVAVEEISSQFSDELVQAVVSLREIKSADEILQLNQAINHSRDMHIAMMTHAKVGQTEAQVMAHVREIALSKGVDIPYSIILTINGQTLHNHSYHNVLTSGQLLLGDFGAESEMHYAGDITRTIPVDKKFNSIQKSIYEIVLETEKQAINQLRAGIEYKVTHLFAARNITEGLKNIGLIRGNTDDILAQGAHALFFPHGLGHPLGLDVHDMENLGEKFTGYDDSILRSDQFGLRSLRLAKKLKPGMVLTVEPGIYFIPELITKWEKENKFRDYLDYDKIRSMIPFGGIRIEDNVLIESDGAQVLGLPIPKEIEEIEFLREQAYV